MSVVFYNNLSWTRYDATILHFTVLQAAYKIIYLRCYPWILLLLLNYIIKLSKFSVHKSVSWKFVRCNSITKFVIHMWVARFITFFYRILVVHDIFNQIIFHENNLENFIALIFYALKSAWFYKKNYCKCEF